MQRRLMALAILFLGSAAFAGTLVSKSAAAVTPEPASAAATVTISNFQFTPKVLRVKTGAEVTWQVKEGSHTVTSDNGAFSSQTLSAGQKFSYTFTKPGTYRYYCSFHGSQGGHDMA